MTPNIAERVETIENSMYHEDAKGRLVYTPEYDADKVFLIGIAKKYLMIMADRSAEVSSGSESGLFDSKRVGEG